MITKKRFITFIIVCCLIGIGSKHLTFLNQWVYLPLFPDILDYSFLIIGSIYLGVMAWRK